MERPERLASALLGLCIATAAVAQDGVTLDVENPRPFGYVIGDRLLQRVTVTAPAALTLAEDALPKAGRADGWLERLPARVSAQRAAGTTRYRIELEYQVMNVPRQVRTVDLPALTLHFRGAGRQAEARLAEWPITLTPLTPENVLARAGLEEMRPDLPPPLVDIRPHALRLAVSLALLALMGAWLALPRLSARFSGRSAFAAACRDLRRLARHPAGAETQRSALRRLHRAFDEAAGRALFAGELPRFFAEFPRYAPLRADVEQFFRASQHAFFGGDDTALPSNLPAGEHDAPLPPRGGGVGGEGLSLPWLASLARRCRDAERAG